MQKTKFSLAIDCSLAGAVLATGFLPTASASSTTMYNLYQSQGGTPCAPCSSGITDGWVWGGLADSTPSGTDTINLVGTPRTINGVLQYDAITGALLYDVSPGAGWAGTAAQNKTPLGYKGGGTLNWAVELLGGGTAEISNADALTRYGVSTDIDVALGAWSDKSMPGQAGWRHDLDFGLFKSDVGGLVTLSALAVNNTTPISTTHFGFTILKGMDISADNYNHHGAWNTNTNSTGLTLASLPSGGTNFGGTPFSTTGTYAEKTAANALINNAALANIVAYSVGGITPSNLNNISFIAEAGQIYTIALGGYQNGSTFFTADGYKLNISQSAVNAVPVPGAVWLFGTTIAGFLGLRRNKKIAA